MQRESTTSRWNESRVQGKQWHVKERSVLRRNVSAAGGFHAGPFVQVDIALKFATQLFHLFPRERGRPWLSRFVIFDALRPTFRVLASRFSFLCQRSHCHHWPSNIAVGEQPRKENSDTMNWSKSPELIETRQHTNESFTFQQFSFRVTLRGEAIYRHNANCRRNNFIGCGTKVCRRAKQYARGISIRWYRIIRHFH